MGAFDRIVDGCGQPTVHRAASGRARRGVTHRPEQRMGEMHRLDAVVDHVRGTGLGDRLTRLWID